MVSYRHGLLTNKYSINVLKDPILFADVISFHNYVMDLLCKWTLMSVKLG